MAHQETGVPVVVLHDAVGPRSLRHMAKQYPRAEIIPAPKIDLDRWVADQVTKGHTVAVSAAQARTMGAFEETALWPNGARASSCIVDKASQEIPERER